MPSRNSDRFTTVRTEGAILPADLLLRVAAGDASLDGLSPTSYHLIEGEKLNEATNRSWNRLLGAWASFQGAVERLPTGDPGTGVTYDRWLLPLWQELGYGRLMPARSAEIDGKSYPVSHAWQHTTIHLVGCRADLDRRAPGVAGAALASPHGLVQELLNRSDEHLWAFVSNGHKLRILRDNIRLTRQAYVEFDLQAMFDGKVYADFALLWRLCHQSRVEAEKPEQCWLERWSRIAQQQGLRVLDQLRNGVEEAISALGRGFLACPANRLLRERLRAGQLDAQDYYRQLLRLVYRLLFLFVVEDRELLFDPKAKEASRERFAAYYSTARLRRMAERIRGTQHTDLYESLALVMDRLGADQGCPELGLPALGSLLFSPTALPDLHNGQLANADLLAAFRALALTSDGHALRAVDYRNLGSEELGSIYESLLELHPILNAEAGTFALGTASGHERKTTGSYYTPTSLITCLLESALDPVLDEAVRQPEPEKALLGMKVCDPACGSGHFLIAAAHRIAKRLGFVRTGEEEPPPQVLRAALRDVIGHCIYGVDINPMAVELCKVALWMEALEPGKPLSFLDHHIQCGNSLLGSTPALLAQGIPDAAFEPIEGDDNPTCRDLRKRNRDERRGQETMFDKFETSALLKVGNLAPILARIAETPDDTIEGVHAQERAYAEMVRSTGYKYNRLWADAWCAAFVIRKEKVDDLLPRITITEATFRAIERNPHVAPSLESTIRTLADQYQFLHWHLAFPDVYQPRDTIEEGDILGWRGGFDVVLGNPPWDTMSPDAKEFFSAYDPQVRFQDREGQQRMIERLMVDMSVETRWKAHCRELYAQANLFKQSGRYQLFAPGNLGKGDFNVFRMFIELALQISREGGWVSQIVPEGLYNGANCMAIREEFFEKCQLKRILGFVNIKEVWFKGLYYRARFCIYSLQKSGTTNSFRASFNIQSNEHLCDVLAQPSLNMPVSLVREFSPEALAIMELGSQLDIDIATKMYAKWPRFGDKEAGPPYRYYMREVDMGNDRELFDEDSSGLYVYEGRMVGQYDNRMKGYRAGRGRSANWEDLTFGDPGKSIQPQWYIPNCKIPDKAAERVWRFRIGFCDVASPKNERTLVASLIPRGCISGHTLPTITFHTAPADVYVPDQEWEWAYLIWLAVANSFVTDWLCRQKVSLHMSYTILDSIPFPRLSIHDPVVAKLLRPALHLACTGPEMADYWNSMASLGLAEPIPEGSIPPGLIDEESRLYTRTYLDAVVARDIFGLSREDLDYILGTFPIAARYEVEQYGLFKTRELILFHYDTLAEGARTGQAYEIRLDPPPADPRMAHPPRRVVAGWRPGAEPGPGSTLKLDNP